MTTVAPSKYQALVGRTFRDIGPNAYGGGKLFEVAEIRMMPFHQHGPWVAVCYALGDPPYKGARFRKIDRFFREGEYEEVMPRGRQEAN